MKVCHITTVHKATDGRIFYKECRSLQQKGYEVSLIAPVHEPIDAGEIRLFNVGTYKSRLTRIILGGYKVLQLSKKTGADLFHFHDPELMPVGCLLRISGKKVVYDVHEDLPRQLLYKDWIRCRLIKVFLSRMVYICEKFFSLFYNGIVTATDDISRKFPPKKTIVLKNYPSMELISDFSCVEFNKSTFTIIYAGGITKIRGIREVIKALHIMEGKVKLILLGEFDDDGYKMSCQKEEGWRYVHYFGWRPIQEVYGYMKKADAGLVALYPAKNFLTSLPVKAFEYMAYELPLVISGFPFWKDVFGSCSVFVDPQDPESIVESVEKLINDEKFRKGLGAAGSELVSSKFSWEKEQKKLFSLYEQILNDGNRVVEK